MKAKFFRADDDLGLGLQFEPETTDEQLLLEAFTREAHASDYRLQFNGFEHNMFGRPLSKGLTAVRGSIVKVPPTTGISGRGLTIDCPACGKPAGVPCTGPFESGWTLCSARLNAAPVKVPPLSGCSSGVDMACPTCGAPPGVSCTGVKEGWKLCDARINVTP